MLSYLHIFLLNLLEACFSQILAINMLSQFSRKIVETFKKQNMQHLIVQR